MPKNFAMVKNINAFYLNVFSKCEQSIEFYVFYFPILKGIATGTHHFCYDFYVVNHEQMLHNLLPIGIFYESKLF